MAEESLASMLARIDAQNEAAQRALSAPAAVATHTSIVARMQREAEQLIAEHGKDQGIALMLQKMEEGKV